MSHQKETSSCFLSSQNSCISSTCYLQCPRDKAGSGVSACNQQIDDLTSHSFLVLKFLRTPRTERDSLVGVEGSSARAVSFFQHHPRKIAQPRKPPSRKSNIKRHPTPKTTPRLSNAQKSAIQSPSPGDGSYETSSGLSTFNSSLFDDSSDASGTEDEAYAHILETFFPFGMIDLSYYRYHSVGEQQLCYEMGKPGRPGMSS